MREPWWKEPTRGQWAAFGAAWFGWVLDAFDFTIFLIVMPAIMREYHVGMVSTTLSIALTLLARLMGGALAGAAADRFGRKAPLLVSLVWFAVCDAAVWFAPSFAWVLVLRTLFGFGMGAEWTAGTTLAMENWPERSRGIASGLLQGSWAVGYLLAAVVAGYLEPRYGWRALFLAAAAPALLVLPIRFLVPESDDWKRATRARPAPLGALRSPAVLRSLAFGSAVMALGFGVYYALQGLYPTLLEVTLKRAPGEKTLLVALFNVGMMAGAIGCGWLAARRSVALAVALPVMLLLPVLPLYVGALPDLLPAGAFFGGAFGAGICGVTPLLLTSLFPAEVRARGVGVAYHVGASLAAFVPPGVAALAERGGVPLGTAIAAVAGTCGLLLAVALARGTPRSAAVLAT